jgi:hypothetical protein
MGLFDQGLEGERLTRRQNLLDEEWPGRRECIEIGQRGIVTLTRFTALY